MMFLELTLYDNNEKIMLNIDRVQSIYQTKAATYIYIGEVVYRVKENYEDIAKCIGNVININIKAESEDKE